MSIVAPLQAQSPAVLSLDIGSSGVRAVLFDAQGRAVEGVGACVSYAFETTSDGGSQMDAERLADCVWRCLDRVTAQMAALDLRIDAVAVDTFVANVLGVDAEGRPVTPLTTYADTRAAADAVALRAELDEDEVHARTGCRLHPSYLPARLRWYARTQPGVFACVARWLSIGEYLERRLFGETAVTYSVASWTGLLHRRALMWDAALLSALSLDTERFSPLTDVDRPRQGLRAPFAGRWPALRDVPWFPAVGDGAAANVGSGCVTPRRVALTVGTTSALRVIVAGAPAAVPPGLWCYRVDRRRSLLGGALTEGGSVYAWMRETLRLDGPAVVEATLAEMAPDAHGLTVLPFWAGERSPGWAGDARAVIQGLSLATTPLEMMQAALEAVAYRLGLVFEQLRAETPAEVEVVVSGGALPASPVWLQMVADVLGRPLLVSRVEETTARGAALLALEALGALPTLAAAPTFDGEAVQPDAERHAVYRQAMARQQALYERLVGS
ncbi:MAG: gluconokinase [Anaerolineae bacterium]